MRVGTGPFPPVGSSIVKSTRLHLRTKDPGSCPLSFWSIAGGCFVCRLRTLDPLENSSLTKNNTNTFSITRMITKRVKRCKTSKNVSSRLQAAVKASKHLSHEEKEPLDQKGTFGSSWSLCVTSSNFRLFNLFQLPQNCAIKTAPHGAPSRRRFPEPLIVSRYLTFPDPLAICTCSRLFSLGNRQRAFCAVRKYQAMRWYFTFVLLGWGKHLRAAGLTWDAKHLASSVKSSARDARHDAAHGTLGGTQRVTRLAQTRSECVFCLIGSEDDFECFKGSCTQRENQGDRGSRVHGDCGTLCVPTDFVDFPLHSCFLRHRQLCQDPRSGLQLDKPRY